MKGFLTIFLLALIGAGCSKETENQPPVMKSANLSFSEGSVPSDLLIWKYLKKHTSPDFDELDSYYKNTVTQYKSDIYYKNLQSLTIFVMLRDGMLKDATDAQLEYYVKELIDINQTWSTLSGFMKC